MFNSTGHLKTQMELMEEYKARDKPKTKKKPRSEVACAAIEVKSMCKPPVAVKETMSAVTSLMGYPRAQAERWATAKKALADMTFSAQLEAVVPSCVPKENVAYAKEKLALYSVEQVKNCSAAAACLYLWAERVVSCCGQ